ncbi:coenzyme A pyrophosphatase [Corynebacterium sp. NML 150383]|uniref:NUDIX hydrolase n=1 Tax=Corynebacterium sp. NML 150383 TaxID=2029400 RepID=UPI000BAA7583|nr:CoA pyrophosphatase [Corynebacterium sp. NML 150383]PAT04228.1 coenzyme A pyrophosphatase [Corynebacterium sp. NML 150383]
MSERKEGQLLDVPLQPHKAPRWLAPLIDRIQRGTYREAARPLLHGRTVPEDAADEAAVLILFTGNAASVTIPDDAHVLITHRTPRMRSHSGQMAFPGGHIDAGDRGPVDAALREAWEETGLERSRVTPLATLRTVTTGGSGLRVRPVIAYAKQPGETYVASPFETDDVFFIAVRDLVDPANRLQVGLANFAGPAFRAGCYVVWGFTAILLSILLEQAAWARDWDRTLRDLDEVLANSANGEPRYTR